MKVSYDTSRLIETMASKLGIDINPNIEDGLVLFLDQKYRIQIEFLEDRIIFSSTIGEVLVSKFRTNVFEDALRANFKSTCFGTLGYSDKNKTLMLMLNYQAVPPSEETFTILTEGFISKARAWSDALTASNTRLLI